MGPKGDSGRCRGPAPGLCIAQAEATISLLDHVISPAKHGHHTTGKLHKLRLKWFGIQIHL